MMKKTFLYLFALLGVTIVALAGVRYFVIESYQNNPVAGGASYADFGAGGGMTSGTSIMASSPSDQASPGQSASDQVMRGMIIRNAYLTLEVSDLARAVDTISQLAEKSGGYVVSSDVNQNNIVSYAGASSQIKIRIPSAGLSSILNELKSLSTKVVQESVSGEDITQTYVDLQGELQNLQATKEQLIKIMKDAKSTPDVLLVYDKLSDTQRRIDSIQGRLKYYKESVAYSLITISLQLSPEVYKSQYSSWEIKKTIKESYEALDGALRNFTYLLIQFVIFGLPMLILWGGVILVFFIFGKLVYKKLKK